MSRSDYGSMLERFNATDGRGDVLSFSREDAARLAELPLEIAAPILHALLKWFLTGEDVPLDDPRDRAMLAGFKEHQLGNAARRGKFLNDQKEKSDKAVQARKEHIPRVTHGLSTGHPSIKERESKSISESVNTFTSNTVAAPPGPPASLAVRLCDSDNDICKESNHDTMQIKIYKGADSNGQPIIRKILTLSDVGKDPIGLIMNGIGEQEKNPPMFRNALRKYRKDIGEEPFLDVAWNFLCEFTHTYNTYVLAKSLHKGRLLETSCKRDYNIALGNAGKRLFAMLNEKKKDLGIIT